MRVPLLRLRSRSKLALLALGWVLWFLAGSLNISYASCANPSDPSDPEFVYAVDCNPDGSPRTIRGGAASNPSPVAPTQSPFPEESAIRATDPYARTSVQQATPGPVGAPGVLQQAPSGPIGAPRPAGGTSGAVQLNNPLSNISSIPDLLAAILNVVIIIAIPIIILFIMLAGFKYVTAKGNPGQIKEATQALMYAVIGGVLIIGATAIAQIIKNLVNAFAAP